MKSFKFLFFVSLTLCPLSYSFGIGGLRLKSPAQKTKKSKNAHDCSERTNTTAQQATVLEELQEQLCKKDINSCNSVQKVKLIGEDDGRIVSNDPNSEEAKLAESIGPAGACGKGLGTLSLIEYEGKTYLVGNSHGLYKNGQYLCKNGEKNGAFMPDYHYKSVNGIDNQKLYKFKLPPLNHATLQRTTPTTVNDSSLKDLVILEVDDPSVFKNQFGQDRNILKIASKPSDQLTKFSKENDVKFVSSRTNFHNYKETSIQNNCKIKPIKGVSIQKHNCDTGPGSSGAPLITTKNNENYVLGIHYDGHKATDKEFESTKLGSYFIPSEYLIKEFKSILN